MLQRTPRSAALAIIGMCNWSAWWYSGDDEHGVEEVAKFMSSFALRALVAGGGESFANEPSEVFSRMRSDLGMLESLVQELKNSS